MDTDLPIPHIRRLNTQTIVRSAFFAASSHRYQHWYRNINLFPIDYAFPPRLRGRLTLSRLALPRKPWAFGEWISHPFYRYSYRHSHFRYLQHTSQYTFTDLRNAPLPLSLTTKSAASAIDFSPVHFRHKIARPVSCYALFKGMAASKPTSWLS